MVAITVFIAVILTTITTYVLFLVRRCRGKKEDGKNVDEEGKGLLEEDEEDEGELELAESEEEDEGESWTKVVDDLEEKKKKKIDHILHEFLETEVRYVNDLRMLDEYFVKPIKGEEYVKKNSILSQNLGKCELILGINIVFLNDLREIISPNESNIGNLEEFSRNLFKFSQTFKLYSDFTARFDMFDREITKMKKKKKKFRTSIEEIEGKMREDKLRMCQLGSYLITPIQRIPRYELMLRDLLKIVKPDFKEHYHLRKAYRTIREMAVYCNNKSKEIKNIQRVKEIQDSLHLKNIVAPHRRLVREGVVERVRNSGKTLKSKILLFSDLLIVYPVKKPVDLTYFKEPYVVELTSPNCKISRRENMIVISYENELAFMRRASLGRSQVNMKSPSFKDDGLKLSFEKREDIQSWYKSIVNQSKQRRASMDNF